MPVDLETLDPDQIDANDPEAVRNLREALKRSRAKSQEATEARTAAEAATAELQAKARLAQVEGVLSSLNAPAQVASLYPADLPVTDDAIKDFLRDKVGFEPSDVNDTWKRYERSQTGKETPPAPGDPTLEWADQEIANTEAFYRKQTMPTDKEIADMQALKVKVFGQLNKWDDDVMAGKRDPMISPQGFGGLLDPPSWAVRAKQYIRQTPG